MLQQALKLVQLELELVPKLEQAAPPQCQPKSLVEVAALGSGFESQQQEFAVQVATLAVQWVRAEFARLVIEFGFAISRPATPRTAPGSETSTQL